MLLSLLACDDNLLDPTVDAGLVGGGPTVKAPSSVIAVPWSASQINFSWQDNSTNESG